MPENIIRIDRHMSGPDSTGSSRRRRPRYSTRCSTPKPTKSARTVHVRAFRRTEGVPGRPLRPEPDRQGRRLELKVPKLKGALFASAVIERYRRRGESVEEALIGMYPAVSSTRQVDDTGQLLWGDRMPSRTLSDKLKRVYAEIDG